MTVLQELDLKKLEDTISKEKNSIKLQISKINDQLKPLLILQKKASKGSMSQFSQWHKKIDELGSKRDLLMKRYSKLSNIESDILRRTAPKKGMLKKAIELGKKAGSQAISKVRVNKGKSALAAGIGLYAYSKMKKKKEEGYR